MEGSDSIYTGFISFLEEWKAWDPLSLQAVDIDRIDHWTERTREIIIDQLVRHNRSDYLRIMLDIGTKSSSRFLARIPRRNNEMRTEMAKFHASRKRARLGAIAVISAISRRRRRGAAAEGGVNSYSKDVALIIARVVWESRGFYSFVSRRHFARRK